jgi:hypothetical protein
VRAFGGKDALLDAAVLFAQTGPAQALRTFLGGLTPSSPRTTPSATTWTASTCLPPPRYAPGWSGP